MKIGKRANITLSGVVTLFIAAAPLAARAEVAGGVVGCDAPGHKQAGGAVIGAVLGGIAGSNLAKNERTAGTVVGATAGAAAGSYVGCKMQKGDAARRGGLEKASYAVGEKLPLSYVSAPEHRLSDPVGRGLRSPPKGSRWVVIEHDAYLVRTRNGVITHVVKGVVS